MISASSCRLHIAIRLHTGKHKRSGAEHGKRSVDSPALWHGTSRLRPIIPSPRLCLIVFPDAVISVITNNPDVAAVARPLLQIAGAAQMFYAPGIVLAHALQAAGATMFVMWVEVLTHWVIFLPTCYVLDNPGKRIVGAWLALPAYIIVYSLWIYLKYRKGTWLHIKV